MSETVIEPVEFENKSGSKFQLHYNEIFNRWEISKIGKLIDCEFNCEPTWREIINIVASYKLQSKAVQFCELLKESE